MSRPKGSKNKSPVEKGNPKFNISQADVLSEEEVFASASTAYSPEDAALDAELNRLASQNEMPASIEPEPPGAIIKKEQERRELLSGVVQGLKPAKSIEELNEQVWQAKREGCDSVEATLAVAKKIIPDPMLEETGYFLFKDIKVYIAGAFEKSKAKESRKLFTY